MARARLWLRGKGKRQPPEGEFSLPPVKQEAAALVAMIGKDGHSAESLRVLIRISERQRAWLFQRTADDPLGRKLVARVIRWREQVLGEFERLLAASTQAPETAQEG